jgi:hypothetical protein
MIIEKLQDLLKKGILNEEEERPFKYGLVGSAYNMTLYDERGKEIYDFQTAIERVEKLTDGEWTEIYNGIEGITREDWKKQSVNESAEDVEKLIKKSMPELRKMQSLIIKQIETASKTKNTVALEKLQSREKEIASAIDKKAFKDKTVNEAFRPLKSSEKVMYGTKKGEPDWKEDIITTDETRFDDAKKWAEENGFDRIRVATINLTKKPDFSKTVNEATEDENKKMLSDWQKNKTSNTVPAPIETNKEMPYKVEKDQDNQDSFKNGDTEKDEKTLIQKIIKDQPLHPTVKIDNIKVTENGVEFHVMGDDNRIETRNRIDFALTDIAASIYGMLNKLYTLQGSLNFNGLDRAEGDYNIVIPSKT